MRLSSAARRASFIALVFGVAACASMEAPAGGPKDSAPPVLLRTLPETNAVNVRADKATFHFDEVISERPSSGSSLKDVFLISPSHGAVDVKWKRNSIDVRPARGRWRPNTTYTVTLLPGLADLMGNSRREGALVVFSTGPELARSAIHGRMFDWVAGRGVRGYVEAIMRPDSIVYIAAADSAGAFTIPYLPRGEYTVRGVIDANSNRALDTREMWDSTRVVVGDSIRVELLAYAHDTLPPQIVSAVAPDTFTIRATLDRALDPAQPLDGARFSLIASDSTVVPLMQIRGAFPYELETGRGRPPVADTAGRGARPPTADTAPPRPATIAAVAPSRPSPIINIVIIPAQPLRPGAEYRLRGHDLRAIGGGVGSPVKVFKVPEARAPAAPPPSPPPPHR